MYYDLNMITLTYLEFYAGIGGWGFAVERALRNTHSHLQGTEEPHQQLHCQLLEAYDHSDLCKNVFNHNHNSGDKCFRQTPIERITQQQLEGHAAHIWCMSPPCQPHTRQHSNQRAEMDDPRSKSFLHLCDMISSMEESTLPCLVLLENVVGFETSGIGDNEEADHQNQQDANRGSFQIWREALRKRKYHVAHFHLDPLSIGLPNARPRHYTVALRPGSLHQSRSFATVSTRLNSLNLGTTHYEKLFALEVLEKPPTIHDENALSNAPHTLPCIGDFLDAECKLESLKIPEKIWSSSSAWCFDVVTPLHHRSACFTHSYGKFIRGTGSILYTGSLQAEESSSSRKRDRTTAFLTLERPEDRVFDAEWSSSIDWERDMRYLSGTEIARLMGFPVSEPAVGMSAAGKDLNGESCRRFSFPDTVNVKQQWKLLGNSLNVKVAATVAEIGIKCLLCSDK